MTATKLLEWSALWAAMRANDDAGRIEWVPTTHGMYWEMLGAVPPARHVGGGFLVGEPHHDNANGETVYAAFRCKGDDCDDTSEFYACYLTLAQFRKLVG